MPDGEDRDQIAVYVVTSASAAGSQTTSAILVVEPVLESLATGLAPGQQPLSDDGVLDRGARGTRRLGTRKVAGVRNAARSGDDVGLVLHPAIIPAPPLG
ncbi:hypothetical protein WR25_27316 [Diploscapter pachys]|uniref:Uncharacterized protein n=1 Tax=Diploscapter pachys TaxID=2018661 RepID=A0A2A2M597_9BILA|nr:hypothetical protein WR25_27316 [Diploscapter pachys]